MTQLPQTSIPFAAALIVILCVNVRGRQVAPEWDTTEKYAVLTEADACDVPLLSIEHRKSPSGPEFRLLALETSNHFHGYQFDPASPPPYPMRVRLIPEGTESAEEFAKKALDWNADFREAVSLPRLLRDFANQTVTAASSNTDSWPKESWNMGDYIEKVVRDPPSLEKLLTMSGDETRYLFGDFHWQKLDDQYHRLPFWQSKSAAFTFGVAPTGSGVPFHIHGPAIAEVLHGAKRWFFGAPDWSGQYDKNAPTIQWLHGLLHGGTNRESTILESIPTTEFRQSSKKVMPAGVTQCTLVPGEILYIPHMWYHATLNVGQAVFVSLFVDTALSSVK